MGHRTKKTCSTRLCLDDDPTEGDDGAPVHKCVFQYATQAGIPLAQALCMPPPDRADPDSTNYQWATKRYGTLQLCKLPCSLMKSVYDVGRRSTPYCHNLCVQKQVAPELADLVKQHTDSDDKDLHLWKTSDGYLLTDNKCNVFALIHAKGFHYHESNPKQCTGDGHILIVAHPPGSVPPPCSFKAVLHNDVCAPDEISRVSTIEHSMRKMLSAVVYNESPRTVYTSPMGELVARILSGANAMLVKSCFVSLAAEEGSDVYENRLELHPDLSALLMLKSSNGNLRCVPCANGFIGYRIQTADPTKRTLVLLANSSDTGADSMQTGEQSNLQIFKFNYVDCNGAERFIVQPTSADCRTPYDVSCTDTVQQILDRAEKVFRDSVSWGSKLHPFEIGANLTSKLPESSCFIDPDAQQTVTQRVIQQFLMQHMALLQEPQLPGA